LLRIIDFPERRPGIPAVLHESPKLVRLEREGGVRAAVSASQCEMFFNDGGAKRDCGDG
jgi:hypothetical protein